MNCRLMLSTTVFSRLVGTRQRAKRSNRLKKIAKRIAAYSAAAVATVLTTQSSANATEVVWDIPDITTDASQRGPKFQMKTGGTTPGFYNSSADQNVYFDFAEGNFRLDPIYGGYLYGPAYSDPNAGTLAFIGEVGDKDGYPEVFADPLPGGSSSVSAADNFNAPPETYYSNRYAYLDFSDGQTAFVGLRFGLNSGADTHFGWAQITRVDSTHFTLHGFGYNNTPGAASHPVNTVIPEPSSVLLLATGAAGLGMWRRRKQV